MDLDDKIQVTIDRLSEFGGRNCRITISSNILMIIFESLKKLRHDHVELCEWVDKIDDHIYDISD